jgi:hypothetical protein
MTHLPYILASYGIFMVAVLAVAFTTRLRLGSTTRRLRALDNRKTPS